MSNETNSLNDFEQVVNRSFDLAVKYQHEYVTIEHLLQACLETTTVRNLLKGNEKQLQGVIADLDHFFQHNSYLSRVAEKAYRPVSTSAYITLIKQAKAQSMFLGKSSVEVFDLMMAMFNTDNSHAVYFLAKNGITREFLVDRLQDKQTETQTSMKPEDAISLLSQFATNLNRKAQQNRIDPLIGRERDVEQIVQILSQKNKNNVLLVGYPGTGKTQIVEGLARRITEGQVPPVLLGKQIWSLDVSNIVAGTKYRGDFEERMKNFITALRSLPDVILFIDEIHMIMGAGSGGQSNGPDVANILKPFLGRGEIPTIGSTTHDEYRKHFEKDRALLRRFLKHDVVEPTPEETRQILLGLLPGFEKFHGVKYEPECIDLALDLSMKFLFNRHLPDKAIDIIDGAGAMVKVKNAHLIVDPEHVKKQVSKMANISLDAISNKQTKVNRDLETNILSKLFGQEMAVKSVVETVWMSLSGLRENNKTMGSFLFSGQSGCGKTELAKLLAENLNYSFVRMDMSEYHEPHSISRLIGSPPGYVGYSDGGAGSGVLINAIETTPQCVLLIDEVEKAHPDVLNIFLQGMDNGIITSANNKSVSLKNVILIFTSNLGAVAMEQSPLGFGRDKRTDEDVVAIKHFFAPEFRNRLDAQIRFNKLSPEIMTSILDKFLKNLAILCSAKNVTITVEPEARKWLATNGFDPQMGARPLGRVIDNHIKKPLSQELLFGKLQNGGSVLVSLDTDADKLKLDYLSRVTEQLGPEEAIEASKIKLEQTNGS